MSAGDCAELDDGGRTHRVRVRDYDLAATLACGQAFRWECRAGAWAGVIGRHPVRLRQEGEIIEAETPRPGGDWAWLHCYLQTEVELAAVTATFPDDEPMRCALAACRGLRLLRQEPWECLASFLLSSTKQIVQIRQIIRQLCEQFGERLGEGADGAPVFAFPTAERLAAASEMELRACKCGFRAPYLLASAQLVAAGECKLAHLASLPLAGARAELMKLPGVGPKIADCVLLFAYGFPAAFPVDVWVLKALKELYFPRRRVSPRRLRGFADTHFGPHGGYAQQYLFHLMRQRAGRAVARREG